MLDSNRSSSSRRRALGALLRAARASIAPPPTADEIAANSGVGQDWYLSLEAGRDVGVSTTALGWVADALQLDAAGRQRAFELAALTDYLAFSRPPVEPVPETLRRLVNALADLPALVYGRCGDLLAWNDAADALYRCNSMPINRRNILMCLFAQPETRRFIVNWEEQAQVAVEMVRTTADPEDRRLAELVEYLSQTSADFPRLWSGVPAGQTVGPTRKVFTRPPVGRLTFVCSYLVPAGEERLWFTVYQADDDETARRLPALVATHRRRTDGQFRKARAVQQVRAYLDEHYRDEVPLDELVAISGIQRFTLLRWFVAEIGLPPRAYQLMVRVARARQLLVQGLPAADVAISVGFSDQSHLIRRFRQLEGMTPGEYVRRSAPIAASGR